MQLPEILEGPSITRLVQGALIGLLGTVLIGFNWGGWMLGSTARQMAENRTSVALSDVLAPICADKFRSATEATANLAEFNKISSWQQDSYIQKGGWATFPGLSAPGIAQACATLLTKTP